MSAFSAGFLSRRAQDFRAGLRHAFAVRPEQAAFTIEDLALLERVAAGAGVCKVAGASAFRSGKLLGE